MSEISDISYPGFYFYTVRAFTIITWAVFLSETSGNTVRHLKMVIQLNTKSNCNTQLHF